MLRREAAIIKGSKKKSEPRKRMTVSRHNVGNLIQMMWNFDNMEEPLIAGTQFDKGAI